MFQSILRERPNKPVKLEEQEKGYKIAKEGKLCLPAESNDGGKKHVVSHDYER